MAKAIMMTVRPEVVVNVLNEESTILILKTLPRCELPIDVYLVCSKAKPYIFEVAGQYRLSLKGEDELNKKRFGCLNGKVVAKFTLNKIDEYMFHDSGYDFSKLICSSSGDVVFEDYKPCSLELKSCLEYEDMVTYAWNKKYGEFLKYNNLYAYHIDNLIIFDKSKEIGEFLIESVVKNHVDKFSHYSSLTRIPKSWRYCYVIEK